MGLCSLRGLRWFGCPPWVFVWCKGLWRAIGGEVDTLSFRDRYFFLRLSGCGMGTWDEVDDSM